MHIVVSWDIAAEGPRWETINKSMREALGGASWVRPLSTYYVVKVGSEQERQAIQAALLARAKAVSEKVHFLVSPLIPSSRYTGYIPSDMWPKLNARTD